MQIQCMSLLKVIFVLSTIVAVTDCCSSRILLLRQQTLQIEERVVQLVNQMELQQELNVDGRSSVADIFADTAQMLQVSSALDIEGELAAIATTEQDRIAGVETSVIDDEITMEKTTNPTTIGTTDISSTTISTTTTNIMATGEPPPDDTTPQMAVDLTITITEPQQESVSPLSTSTAATTATTTTTTTTITTTAAVATTLATATTTTAATPTTAPTDSSIPKLTDELSFKLPCSKTYLEYFCLNGGHCFRWANSFSYCVCAVGYVGERCDSKTENGVYVQLQPTTPEPQLKTAHIVFSFPMLVLLSTIYVLFGAVFMLRTVSAQRRKQEQLDLHKQRFFVSC